MRVFLLVAIVYCSGFSSGIFWDSHKINPKRLYIECLVKVKEESKMNECKELLK